jgi:hypothetical protein
MSPSGEGELISLLTEIRADIRQIKSDLQSLLPLLKQQPQNPTPPPSSSNDDTPNDIERAQPSSPDDVVRYLRETRGGMIQENRQAMVCYVRRRRQFAPTAICPSLYYATFNSPPRAKLLSSARHECGRLARAWARFTRRSRDGYPVFVIFLLALSLAPHHRQTARLANQDAQAPV